MCKSEGTQGAVLLLLRKSASTCMCIQLRTTSYSAYLFAPLEAAYHVRHTYHVNWHRARCQVGNTMPDTSLRGVDPDIWLLGL